MCLPIFLFRACGSYMRSILDLEMLQKLYHNRYEKEIPRPRMVEGFPKVVTPRAVSHEPKVTNEYCSTNGASRSSYLQAQAAAQ